MDSRRIDDHRPDPALRRRDAEDGADRLTLRRANGSRDHRCGLAKVEPTARDRRPEQRTELGVEAGEVCVHRTPRQSGGEARHVAKEVGTRRHRVDVDRVAASSGEGRRDRLVHRSGDPELLGRRRPRLPVELELDRLRQPGANERARLFRGEAADGQPPDGHAGGHAREAAGRGSRDAGERRRCEQREQKDPETAKDPHVRGILFPRAPNFHLTARN